MSLSLHNLFLIIANMIKKSRHENLQPKMQQFKPVSLQVPLVFSSQKLGQQTIITQDFYFKPCKFAALIKSFQNANYRLRYRFAC